MNIKISVIMPVYNTASFLKEAVESILNQTFSHFEFVIIDDFSNDWSYEILKEYQKTDKRIILYRNDKNRGISYTRNKLISLANTNYILSQDSDDISEINRLEILYNFLENNLDFWVVSGNNIIIDEQSNIIWYRKYSNDIKNTILKKSPISQPSCMFRKDIFLKLGWYDKSLNYGEDYDMWVRFYLNWYKIKNIDKYLIKYRIREWQSKSHKLKQTIKNTIFIQKRAIKNWLIPSIWDIIYIFIEKILLFLPNSFILCLFKKLEYKNAK